MPPETAKLLADIAQAAARIVDYTDGADRDDYLADPKLRDAVQWNFVVIGEALSQLHKPMPQPRNCSASGGASSRSATS
jgi:uncharacterized protein with HEPN domain